jgi:twitching motility two-component system response regulator PilH
MADGEAFQSVLIIDDDLTLREMYEEYLKASGFNVISAQDGEEGLARAKESIPSAILLDLMMPKMNGIEVLRHLKADDNTKNIPVIVFTALIQDLEKQESFAAGASDYVVKTEVTPKAVLDKIHQFAGGDADDTTATPASQPAEPNTQSPRPVAPPPAVSGIPQAPPPAGGPPSNPMPTPAPQSPLTPPQTAPPPLPPTQ